jgi:beta-xylosidase
VTLPAQQLIGFARVDLEPGKSKTVNFEVPLSVLAYTGISGETVIEPGPVEVSAAAARAISDQLPSSPTPATRAIKGEGRAFLSVATVGSGGATVH